MTGYNLVALTLLAIVAGACADQCGTASAGIVDDNRYRVKELDKVVLNAGTKVFAVTIPPNVCSKAPHVGTTLMACDVDIAPSVTMMSDIRHGKVYRNGAWQYNNGILYTYVYCPY